MSESRKNWGETVLGWFVVRDGSEGDEAQEAVSPTPAAAPAMEPVGELPAAKGGRVDFDGVFGAFGIDGEARDRLGRADGLLKSLPAGTDAAVKRQIVEASLKAFGVPFEQIIATACAEIQALDAYQKKGAASLQSFCDEAERRIQGLESEIRSIREAMTGEVESQRKTLEACNQRKLEVQRVLEFFGPETVGRVVRDSPRLIDPSAPGAAGVQPGR